MIPWSRISTRTVYEIKYIHIHKDGNDYSCTCRPAAISPSTDRNGSWQLIALETTSWMSGHKVAFIRKKLSSPTLQFIKERKLGILSNFFFIWVSFQRRFSVVYAAGHFLVYWLKMTVQFCTLYFPGITSDCYLLWLITPTGYKNIKEMTNSKLIKRRE